MVYCPRCPADQICMCSPQSAQMLATEMILDDVRRRLDMPDYRQNAYNGDMRLTRCLPMSREEVLDFAAAVVRYLLEDIEQNGHTIPAFTDDEAIDRTLAGDGPDRYMGETEAGEPVFATSA